VINNCFVGILKWLRLLTIALTKYTQSHCNAQTEAKNNDICELLYTLLVNMPEHSSDMF